MWECIYCPSFTTEVVLFFVALVAKQRVASQYHFNEKPHTIADVDMVSHHVITLFFVLLATRSIQKTVPTVGCILPAKWQKRW